MHETKYQTEVFWCTGMENKIIFTNTGTSKKRGAKKLDYMNFSNAGPLNNF